MTTTDPWTAFITARLDEDEQTARAATPGPWRHNPDKHWRKPGTAWFEEAVFAGPAGADATCVAGTGESDDRQSMADADHIARHGPARVLREVETLRAILADHYEQDDGYCVRCGPSYEQKCSTVLAIADIWRDHPDHPEGQL